MLAAELRVVSDVDATDGVAAVVETEVVVEFFPTVDGVTIVSLTAVGGDAMPLSTDAYEVSGSVDLEVPDLLVAAVGVLSLVAMMGLDRAAALVVTAETGTVFWFFDLFQA